MFAKSWRRLKIYKRLFTFCVVANVFCLCLVGVFSFQYWSSKKEANEKISLFSEQSAQLEKAQASTLALSEALKTYKKSKNVEKEAHYWGLWKAVQDSAPAYYKSSAFFGKDFYSFIAADPGTFLFEYTAWLHEERIKGRLVLKSMYQDSYNLTWELFWVAGLTLLFGIVLPLVLMNYIRKAIFSLKKDMEAKAAKWVSQWVKAHSKDKAAFKSPEFWAKTVLFAVEEFGPASRHPAMYYLSELSHTVRIELENQSEAA